MRNVLGRVTALVVLSVLCHPSFVSFVHAADPAGYAVVSRSTADEKGNGTLCIAAKPGTRSEAVSDALAHKLEVSGGAQLDTIEIAHGVATAKYTRALKGATVEGSVPRDIKNNYGLLDCKEALAAAPPEAEAAGIGAASIIGGVLMVGTGLGLGIAGAEGAFGTTTFPGKPPVVPPGPPPVVPPGPPPVVPPGPPPGIPPGPPPGIPNPPVTASQ